MKGLKLLASCAAVGALAVTCAAASFAADYNATATYSAETGKVAITVPADYVTAVGGGDLTLLILSEDATNITEENKDIVKQIQQGDQATVSDVAVGALADGTYYVRVGGAEVGADNPNGYIATTFTVGAEKPSYMLGDVNVDTFIDMGDAAAILNHYTGAKIIENEISLLAADVNIDTYVDMGDAAAILNHYTGAKLIVQPE